jgi:hypothetical protein
MNHAYVLIVSGGMRGVGSRVEAIGVALVRQIARELVYEEAAVGQDEDAGRAGGLDESGRGDRLA